MKRLKSTLIAAFSVFTLSGTLLSSCTTDPCNSLNCQNGASCSDGHCVCPAGYEGAECDLLTVDKFTGKYQGALRCDQFPIDFKEVEIVVAEKPNVITLKMGAGNTSVLDMTGVAETPETHIQTYVEELEATIHAYIRVDGDVISIYLESISLNTTNRQVCRFNGLRVK